MNTIYFLIDGENIDATLGVNILKRFPRGEERPRWDRVLHFNPWAQNGESELNPDLYPHLTQNEEYNRTQVTNPENYANPVDSETFSDFEDSNPSQHHPDAVSCTNPVPTPNPNTFNNPENTAETEIETAQAGEERQKKPVTPAIFEHHHAPVSADSHSVSDTRGLFFLNASHRVAKSFVQALLAMNWQPILLTSENPELKIVDIGIQKTIEAIAQKAPKAKVVIASHDVDYLPQIEMLLDSGHEVAILCFREYLSLSIAQLEERGLKILDLEYDVNAFTIPLSRVTTIDINEYNPYDFI